MKVYLFVVLIVALTGWRMRVYMDSNVVYSMHLEQLLEEQKYQCWLVEETSRKQANVMAESGSVLRRERHEAERKLDELKGRCSFDVEALKAERKTHLEELRLLREGRAAACPVVVEASEKDVEKKLVHCERMLRIADSRLLQCMENLSGFAGCVRQVELARNASIYSLQSDISSISFAEDIIKEGEVIVWVGCPSVSAIWSALDAGMDVIVYEWDSRRLASLQVLADCIGFENRLHYLDAIANPTFEGAVGHLTHFHGRVRALRLGCPASSSLPLHATWSTLLDLRWRPQILQVDGPMSLEFLGRILGWGYALRSCNRTGTRIVSGCVFQLAQFQNKKEQSDDVVTEMARKVVALWKEGGRQQDLDEFEKSLLLLEMALLHNK